MPKITQMGDSGTLDCIYLAAQARMCLLMNTNEELSKREREILGLLSDGLSNNEIAGQTDLSINTVKTHLKRIYRKIGARNRADAARIFIS